MESKIQTPISLFSFGPKKQSKISWRYNANWIGMFYLSINSMVIFELTTWYFHSANKLSFLILLLNSRTVNFSSLKVQIAASSTIESLGKLSIVKPVLGNFNKLTSLVPGFEVQRELPSLSKNKPCPRQADAAIFRRKTNKKLLISG